MVLYIYCAYLCLIFNYLPMNIPKDLFAEWNLMKDHGDIKGIVKQSNISKNTILEAFRTGKATEKTMAAINKYFVIKRKRSAARILAMSEKLLS